MKAGFGKILLKIFSISKKKKFEFKLNINLKKKKKKKKYFSFSLGKYLFLSHNGCYIYTKYKIMTEKR